jgi:energy-coupling factor transporter ATP-binding protein EcfA2
MLKSRFTEITGMGIGVPPIVRLAKAMEAGKAPFENLPLTVKEGRAELKKVLESSKPEPFYHSKKADRRAIVRTENLSFAYSGNTAALKNINLEIYRGELVAIMGRNASGKSTLIHHFNGLLKPSQGKVWVDDIDTRQCNISGLAREIGFVFQNPDDHLFADTVEEEVSFTLKYLGYPKREIESRVNQMISKFKLEAYRKQYPRSLSGGEKQRVVLASVIAAEPPILVLDEPTRGLQQGLKDELMRLLKEYTSEGRTVILVSHDVETVAEFADRVILLSEGEVVVAGSRYEVLSKALLFSPQINRLVQSFSNQGLAGDILTVTELSQVLN